MPHLTANSTPLTRQAGLFAGPVSAQPGSLTPPGHSGSQSVNHQVGTAVVRKGLGACPSSSIDHPSGAEPVPSP